LSYWKNKCVVVTGGAGFLGTVVVDLLQNQSCRNIVVPRKAEYNLVDMQDVTRLYEDAQPDVVIHLAASVGGIGANLQNPGKFFYDNIMMGTQMMEVGRQKRLEKFVAVGTVCSYPKFTPIPFHVDDFWGGYPEETNAPYGLAKKMLAIQSQAYRTQYGFNSIFLLPANLYGPGDNFDEQSSHVIPAFIHKCVQARRRGLKKITLWGTGSATREFLYVADAAKAIVLASEQYNDSYPLNIGTGQEIGIKDLWEIIQGEVGYCGEVIWNSEMPDGQPRRCLDVRAMKRLLNFSPEITLENGLKHTIRWYESHCLEEAVPGSNKKEKTVEMSNT
jgi:GDP-L-fucose synthase